MSKISASRITTINRVYLIITLFVTLIFCLVLLTQVQMDALSAIRAYVGGEGLWAKAQKDAVRSLEHYAISSDEADYLAYRRQIQVPLGDMKARIELQKKNPDIAVVLAGFVQGRNHPDDNESAVRFFRRFQHSAYMSQVIGHWTAGDRMIVELNGVAEALHEEVASGRNNHKVVHAYLTRLDDINLQVTVEENLFSSTLAEASRWANNVSRNLTYAIALLFVALGAGLSWPIITRIRRTENALVESEGRYRGIFEEVGDIIYTIEADGRISSLSPAFERLTGWLPEEWVGRPFADIIHRDDLPQAHEIFRKTMLGESTTNFEVRINMKSGAYFDADHRVVPILVSGKSVVLLGVARDITERKRAEESIRINQSRFSTIFNQAPLGIALIDSFTGGIYEVNPRFAEITGRTIEEMASIDWMSFTYPDDVQKDLDNMALLNAGKIPGFRMDKRYIRPDGSIVWVNMTIAPLKNGGISPSHLCMIDDITEDKLAAESLRKANVDLSLFRKLLDNSSDAIEVIDPVTSRFLDVNETACRDLGYSREELLSMSIFDIDSSFSQDTKKMIEEQVQKSGAARYEGIHRRKDGSSFAVEVSIGTASLDKLYVLCVVRDITERKLTEEKIRKLNEELEAKVQKRTKQLLEAQEELVRNEKLAVLGQVAGSVGHELRNPLGVMSNAVYFLQTVLSDADETTKEYLNIIKDEIAGSERIVSDLLDSVRTKPPQIQTVGITELIEQTLRKYIVPSSVTVKLDIPATLPPLRVDAMQIQQVLRNLISNGVEAMPEGGTLEIRAVENKQDRTVTVSVRDSGIGMAPEVLPKLFQPLFTTKARGIGLGLVVVKNLTQANGGSVKVESEVGKGSVFSVILPADQ
jgi:PAS domain S-box-containing protein